eukprot:TRINITY_DN69426_c0_g1_i1.p2 TRINITY_DN69426_c0_g1~~TRINITY_DN69426_c0_g1_i1.p2  ORF type:complete len:136 (-),score=13.90 TRINITY_DN69426_c0_g1_i1:141-548(-)
MAVNDLDFVRHDTVDLVESTPAVGGVGLGRQALRRVDEKPVQFAAKRGMDIAISASALIVLLPLLVLIALAVRLTSRGPALFSQLRWGKDCEKIRVYKFRTMYSDLSDHTGVDQTREGDHRINAAGRRSAQDQSG